MENQEPKKQKKNKTKKKSQNKEQETVTVESSTPPNKSEDYDGWKNWYKTKILKGLSEGKEEAFIAFELGIQPQSIKKFLS